MEKYTGPIGLKQLMQLIKSKFTEFDTSKANESDLSSHTSSTSNPHKVTKSQLGLGNVDNTSDADKPVSTAQATAIADAKKAGTDAQTNLESHTGSTANPHSVTKAQVGLGNVPNVATNDQTPTYSAASTLATLTSGEKLSVSMGKIMKAITDLISHIGNKSNPHGVSLTQLGVNATATELNYMDGVTSAVQTQLNAKAAKSSEITATLSASSWSGSGPYTYTLTASGVTASVNGSIGLSPSATDAQYEAAALANIRITAQSANSITLTATGTKPTVNIPVVVILQG